MNKLLQALNLQDYDFVIEHIKGVDNVAADALSRIHISSFEDNNNSDQILAITRSMTNNANRINGSYIANSNFEVRQATLIRFSVNEISDAEFRIGATVFSRRNRSVKKKTIPRGFTEEELVRQLLNLIEVNSETLRIESTDPVFQFVNHKRFIELVNLQASNISMIIMQPIQVIESADDRRNLLKHYHEHPLEGGHIGQKRLYHKLRSLYTWKGMSSDVARFVRECTHCSVNKPKIKNREKMILTPTANAPFHTIAIDTIGPFPSTVNQSKYAVTIICEFSKYLIIIPIPNKSAKTIAKAFMDNCLLIFGPVKIIKSDLGTEYVNQIFEELMIQLNIEHNKSTAYHHESLGTIERSHKTLNEYLRSYIQNNIKDWYNFVKYFAFCFNTSPNSSINMYSPFELVYGRMANPLCQWFTSSIETGPMDVNVYVQNLRNSLHRAYEATKRFIDINKSKCKEYYDSNSTPINIKVGDNVLLDNIIRNKLDPLYKHGYIVSSISHPNVKIKNITTGREYVVHKNRLRK